ncbi:MAG: hypothetical protein EPN43_00760, partial [Jatrophihabitans sp.]
MPAGADSVLGWLRGRTDGELADLLRRRPDLTLPAPADLTALAGRLSVRSSVQRALDGLDAYTLQVLAAVMHGDAGSDGHDPAFGDALADLRALALVWDDG